MSYSMRVTLGFGLLALLVPFSGCSDDPNDPPSGGGGSGAAPSSTAGAGGTPGTSSGGGGGESDGGQSSGGQGGKSGAVDSCDLDSLTDHFGAHGGAECIHGEECTFTMDCTGGTPRTFTFTCDASSEVEEDHEWVMNAGTCEHPFESCDAPEGFVGAIECHAGDWRRLDLDPELDERALCPKSKPNDGQSCAGGDGCGSDAKECGYPCENGNWTITGCNGGVLEEEGEWESDGNCDNPPGTALGGSAGSP